MQLDANLQSFQQLLVKGRLFIEMDVVAKSGTVIPVDLNAVVLPNGRIYCSCRDITKRRQMAYPLISTARFSGQVKK